MTPKQKLQTLQIVTMDTAEIAQKTLDLVEVKGLYDPESLEAMLTALERIAAVPAIFDDAVR